MALKSNPNKVAGFGGIDFWKDGRETYDNIHLVYSYPNGVKASFTCLTSNAKDDYQIKVMGENATILIDHQNAWKYPEGKYNKIISDVDGVLELQQAGKKEREIKLIMIIRILQYKLWKIFVHL